MYTGKTEVSDVMSPNGSSDLVDPIYNNAVLCEPFKEQLVAVIYTYVHHRLQASADSLKPSDLTLTFSRELQ